MSYGGVFILYVNELTHYHEELINHIDELMNDNDGLTLPAGRDINPDQQVLQSTSPTSK